MTHHYQKPPLEPKILRGNCRVVDRSRASHALEQWQKNSVPANPKEDSYFPFFARKQIVIPITWLSVRLLLDALVVNFASSVIPRPLRRAVTLWRPILGSWLRGSLSRLLAGG